MPVARSIVLIVVLVILLNVPVITNALPGVHNALRKDVAKANPRPVPATIDYEMTRVFTIGANGGTANFDLKVPRPSFVPEVQDPITVSPTPAPDSQSGGFMLWNADVTGTKTIQVSYVFTAHTKVWDYGPDDAGPRSAIPPAYQKYLAEEWKISPNDPEIKALGLKIVGSETNSFTLLEKVYRYMRANVHYEKQRGWEPQDPLSTLHGQTGDCDDQSILYASLVRSLGLPAWMEMGALYDISNDQWGGHAWLQVYVPLKDGTGVVVNVDMANDQFLTRDPYRLTEWVDDGDAAHFQDYYILWRYSAVSGNPEVTPGQSYVTVKYTPSKAQALARNAATEPTPWRVQATPGLTLADAVVAVVAAGLLVIAVRRRKAGRV